MSNPQLSKFILSGQELDITDAIARQTANTANQTANAANQIANTAKQTANTAKQTADTAKQTADTAKQTADSALAGIPSIVYRNTDNAIVITTEG